MPPNRSVNITVKVMSGMNTVSIAGLQRDITLVVETLEIDHSSGDGHCSIRDG